ncbi:MAG TPA: nicotinate phosphoribosyltransferase [Acidobacteriota bacterium]|nr:nicotinate phosphoribosyltransferase [Acidobacteriota bacterium]
MKHALMALERMGLSTDLYELTMAQAFLEADIVERQATFDLSVRALPPERGYLIAAGLEQALAYIRDLRFRPEALGYLESCGHFRQEFVDYLASMRFTGSVDAIPEGTVYFPPGPLLRITAPIIEAQILETYLLTTLAFQSMVASKASRVVEAAGGRAVIDFSPRRDHGPQAGLLAARASYIGGCIGTSNVLANDQFGIPMFGTMAHSFVMFHRDEEEAFRVFSRSYPGDPTLLIDTFDTLESARIAVKLLPELAERGQRLAAVRLDSGDLLELSRQVREILDEGGATDTKIFASGDLDEHKIAKLVADGAKIDGFGVGTQLGTSGDAPTLSSTYKLVACDDEAGNEIPVIKLSAAKVSLPGRKQIWRRRGDDGELIGDAVGMEDEDLPGAPLLVPYMANGRLLRRAPALEEIRSRAADQVGSLPVGVRRLSDPQSYPVEISPRLAALMEQLQRR